jgi:hypothetical protein
MERSFAGRKLQRQREVLPARSYRDREKFCRPEVTEGERERVNREAVRFLVFC